MSSFISMHELYPFATVGFAIRTLEGIGPTLSRYSTWKLGDIGGVPSTSKVGSSLLVDGVSTTSPAALLLALSLLLLPPRVMPSAMAKMTTAARKIDLYICDDGYDTYETSAHHVSKIYDTVKNVVEYIHDSMTTYSAITFCFLLVTPAAVLCGLDTVGGLPLSTSPPLSNAIIVCKYYCGYTLLNYESF